jgi:fatty acid/phospholipid biosynthesis enzyme
MTGVYGGQVTAAGGTIDVGATMRVTIEQFREFAAMRWAIAQAVRRRAA